MVKVGILHAVVILAILIGPLVYYEFTRTKTRLDLVIPQHFKQFPSERKIICSDQLEVYGSKLQKLVLEMKSADPQLNDLEVCIAYPDKSSAVSAMNFVSRSKGDLFYVFNAKTDTYLGSVEEAKKVFGDYFNQPPKKLEVKEMGPEEICGIPATMVDRDAGFTCLGEKVKDIKGIVYNTPLDNNTEQQEYFAAVTIMVKIPEQREIPEYLRAQYGNNANYIVNGRAVRDVEERDEYLSIVMKFFVPADSYLTKTGIKDEIIGNQIQSAVPY